MNLNLTLLGQMITFALFIWFTMKYVWPPVTKALDERQKKIADGLAAAERGQHDLELAQHKAVEHLREAKHHAAEVMEQANKRADQIIEEARQTARTEGQRLVALAQADIAREFEHARQSLREQVGQIAISGAEKLLKRHIDVAANQDILSELLKQVQTISIKTP
jgi:F-type H+-transporting ATPase subunit b